MKNISPFLRVATIALVLAAGNAQAQLYKCKDESGRTHYGETMPAACAKKEVTEISKQGREVRKLDAPLTQEQIQARSDAAAKKAADDKRVAEQRMKDMAMLSTYGSEREIDIARDKDMAVLESRRKLIQGRIAEADERLKKITNEMEFYVAGKSQTGKTREPAKDNKDSKDSKAAATKNREVPPQVQADFDRAKSGRISIDVELARLEADRKLTAQRYEIEKDRYRRLKNGMRPGTILDERGNVVIDGVVPRNVMAPAPTKR
jgi:Domain of unknown function (DUF4124)